MSRTIDLANQVALRKGRERKLREGILMNCFQLVKTVLDELYVRLPGLSEDEKTEAIIKMLRYLEEQYAGLARGLRIDYTDPVTRFAYVYKYVTSHANIVCQIIEGSTELTDLLRQGRFSVTCIGGGPGSDLLGILKHVLSNGARPVLRCTLLDGETTWADCWSDVDEKLSDQLLVKTSFQTFDVTNERTWATTSKYLDADLITMIYFMSEVYSQRKFADSFFSNLFGNVSSGTLFLYVDNNSPEFYKWFDALAAANGLEVLQSSEGRMGIADLEEEKKDLGEYFTRLGVPKLKPNIAYRVCRKR